eukprot:CFRG7438T1
MASLPTSSRLQWHMWEDSKLHKDLACLLWTNLQVTGLFSGHGEWSREQVLTRLDDEMNSQTIHGCCYWPIFLKSQESVDSKNSDSHQEGRRKRQYCDLDNCTLDEGECRTHLHNRDSRSPIDPEKTSKSDDDGEFSKNDTYNETTFVGVCGLRMYNRTHHQVKERPCLELGVHLLPKYWSMGFATEATSATVAFAFDVLMLNNYHLQPSSSVPTDKDVISSHIPTQQVAMLMASHHPKNQKSKNMLEKAGFRHGGEEFCPPTGQLHSVYTITREEYTRERQSCAVLPSDCKVKCIR